MRLQELGEFGLINFLKSKLPPLSDRVVQGAGDDTAVLQPDGNNLTLMTTDMLVEEVHFSLRYGSLKAVGWKALAVNVSDIAAMGGSPASAVVSIALPSGMEVSQAGELYQGLGECAAEYGVDVVGGDTVKSPGGLIINVALLGRVEPGQAIYRSGAGQGDVIMVTGPLGSSAAGLYLLNNPAANFPREYLAELTGAHLFPSARVREGRILSGTGAVTAMNDISDGLASEVLEICAASAVGCELYPEIVPYSRAAAEAAEAAGVTPLEWALYGGEDFELVFTVRATEVERVKAALEEAGSRPTVVGKIVTRDQGTSLVSGCRKTVLNFDGYNHFRD